MRVLILALAAVLAWVSPSWAVTTFSTSTIANNSASATTIASPAIAITAGQLAVICAKWENNVTVTMTSSTGDTVTMRTAQQHSGNSPSGRCGYVTSTSAGASTVYTATFSGAAIWRVITVEVFNYTGTMAFDVQSADSSESTSDLTPSSANVTTTGTDEVCVAWQADFFSQNFTGETINSVARDGRVTSSDTDMFYKIFTGTFTGPASLTRTATVAWVQQLNCFTTTGGGGGPVPPPTVGVYYVDQSIGSDSNNGTSEVTPFLTFKKCTQTAHTPGDTCLVKNGTYTETTLVMFDYAGTLGKPITWKNYPGHTPIIHFTGLVNGIISNPDPSIQVTNHLGYLNSLGYGVIEGLEIEGGGQACIKIDNANNFIIRGNNLHHCGQGVLVAGSYKLTLDGNTVWHNGAFTTCLSDSTHCNKDHGLYVQGSAMTITNNVIYDNLGFGIQVAAHAKASYISDTNHAGFNNSLIAHNTIAYQNYRAGIVLWDNNMSGAVIENNIFYENSQLYNSDAQGIEFCCSGSSITSSGTIRNNRAYGTGNSVAFTISSTGSTPSGWTFSNNCPSSPTGSNCTNPNLVNATATLPASPDFRLTASSAAIDAGFAGLGRPSFSGSAPDVGRYETFGFKQATITGNTMLVTADMNVATFNPILPATGQTGWTVNNGRTITAAIRLASADSIVALTISGGACADSETWTVTYTPGNVTDTPGQKMSAFSAQPVTKINCSGGTPPTAEFTQKTHQFLDAFYATGTTTTVALSTIGAANTDIHSGIPFALDMQTDCTIANCLAIGQRLYYSLTPLATGVPGAFTAVTDSASGTDQIGFFGISSDPAVVQGALAASCLTGALTPTAGTTLHTSAAIPIFDLPQDGCVVNRYVLKLGSFAALGDIYQFKVLNQTGDLLTTYDPVGGAKLTVTPTAAISPPAGLHQVGPASNTIIEMVWAPSTNPTLAGYRGYICTSTPCTSANWLRVFEHTPATSLVSHSPMTQWRTSVLVAGTYYFVVTAFDSGGQESAASTTLAVTRTGFVTRTPRTP